MQKKPWLVPLLICLFYLATHIFYLTSLPVFADESIYIRWAQLILDDVTRYLFFPLNDGKTPLFIWLLAPFQYLFSDQLLAGRIVSVLAGVAQVLATGYLLQLLGARQKTTWLGILLVSMLPFWFFHHRMALMDGLLTVWLTLLMICLVKLNLVIKNSKRAITSRALLWTGLAGISLGMALWTKIPALLFAPTIALFGLWQPKLPFNKRKHLWLFSIGAGLLGLGLFASLRISPAFGQLFSRGSDFLYPWQEVFLQGVWQTTIFNFPSYISYFTSYLTIPVMILVLAGLFTKPHQRTNHILFWSALGFLIPIALLGKVVYPRYLLPASIFFTLMAVLAFQDLVDRWIHQQHHLATKLISSVILVLFLANTLATSTVFMAYAWFSPNQLPLVSADQTQYLTDWSSGHGIIETVALIKAETRQHSLAVATEGFFGTLPDALLMYFHRQNVDNLYLEGIGQPVYVIPESFSTRAKDYDQIWLVVNSHRLKMDVPPEKKVAEFCRPTNAPCLQIWDITDQVKQSP